MAFSYSALSLGFVAAFCVGLCLVWFWAGLTQRSDLRDHSILRALFQPFERFQAQVTRNSRYTVLVDNMHRMQKMLESYAVTGAVYPRHVSALYQDAARQNYWWGFRNPFEKTLIRHYQDWMADYSSYVNHRDHTAFRGKVLYEPVGEPPQSYRIYACDEWGKLLLHADGRLYVLTNQAEEN